MPHDFLSLKYFLGIFHPLARDRLTIIGAIATALLSCVLEFARESNQLWDLLLGPSGYPECASFSTTFLGAGDGGGGGIRATWF